jgi:ring-1,2-phenylacetyl-CoA epoxidase subunit PaaD
VRSVLSREEVWRALADVLDPEVPALSVVDLGIVRDVRITDEGVEVDITPTYSGCPALEVIEQDITAALERAGALPVHVRKVYRPAWTTDWISEEGRERLRSYGIAPPGRVGSGSALIPLRRRVEAIPCPYCGSGETEMRSEFGSTACKAIWYCNRCRQPFEYFKPI